MNENSSRKDTLSFVQVDKKHNMCICKFHPKERYLFAVGGKGGKLKLCCALMKKSLYTISLPSYSRTRIINGLNFQCTGEKIVVTCESPRLSIVDVKKQKVIITYDNFSSYAKGKQPVITHPEIPHIAACVSANLKGITLFDFRMPLPLDIISDLYDCSIADLVFLDNSWPWGPMTLLSGASFQDLKVTTIGAKTKTIVSVKDFISTLTVTPGGYVPSSNPQDFQSVIVSAGDKITCQSPFSKSKDRYKESFDNYNGSVTRAKYSLSGGLLYTASSTGSVTRYRRYPDHHEVSEELYGHDSAVLDFDISSHEDFLVSTSDSQSVALYNLGIPSHGYSQCWELT